MSDIDLTEAIEAAYRAHHVARWGREMAPGEYEATYSRIEAEWMAASVAAAAPLIEEKVREQIRTEEARCGCGVTVQDCPETDGTGVCCDLCRHSS